MIFIGDSETNGLLDEVTKFHCLVFSPIDEDKFYVFCNHEELTLEEKELFPNTQFLNLNDYLKFIDSPKTTGIIMHNILSYDLPVMEKLSGITYDYNSINGRKIFIGDTLVMSRYLSPDRFPPKGTKSPHSLQAWGIRLGVLKPEVSDWSDQPLSVYVHRCREDVIINKLTYFALLKEMNNVAIPNGDKLGDWKLPLRMAHKTTYLMQQQEKTGVLFDVKAAEKLIIRIDKEMKEIEEKVEPILGDRELPKGQQPKPPENPWKKPFNFDSVWTQKLELRKPVVDYLNLIGYTDKENQKKYIEQIDEDRIELHPSLLTVAAINYGAKIGITDLEELHQEFIRLKEGGKVVVLKSQMKLANQDDIKQFLIKNKWLPTLWKTKNLLTDIKTKKNYEQDVQDLKIKKYIEDLKVSPYRRFILKELGYKKSPDFDSKSFFNAIKKNGRNIPSSPQLKDIKGNLCPNLEKIDVDIAKDIVLWLSLRNRRTTIKSFDKNTGWLNHKRLLVDNRLPASSSGITNTTRQKHHIVCNIPAPSDDVVLGKEVRGLFIAPKGYCCVGADASGIEGRAMAEASWNFDGGAYADIVLKGDVHQENANAFSKAIGEEVSRKNSKSPFYACVYGCQDKKMATLLGVDDKLGGDIINAIWSVAPGLKACKDSLEMYWEATGKKYIMAINGMKIFTRSKHSLLNAFVQSMDSILMDWACCWVYDKIKEEGLDAKRWIYYHDELNHYNNIKNLGVEYFPIDNKPNENRDGKQYSKPKIFREGEILHFEPKKELWKESDQWIQWYSRVGEICVEGIRNAGKAFNFRVPMDGQYIVGGSWASTH